MATLKINGTEMPEPAFQGVTFSTNKVWSADTGRVSSGKMAGTLLCVKSKIEIKWPPLTYDQVAVIENAVSDVSTPWCSVQYTDGTGKTTTKTMYFGDITYTQYSWVDGICYIMDASVDGIER